MITMFSSIRPRMAFLLFAPLLFIFLTVVSIRKGYHQAAYDVVKDVAQDLHDKVDPPPPPPPPEEKEPEPYKPKYKDVSDQEPFVTVENFPIAMNAQTVDQLPSVPSWNKPPVQHVPQSTPLFIGFTRNWRLLQQTVVSYIAAGWPVEDIYVVDNSGVMNSNAEGLLTLQNPFFLNHTRLNMFGVKIITTPTLLTFAQLQNFFTYTAMDRGWKHYWWSHMDAIIIGEEDVAPYASPYAKALKVLEEVWDPDFARHPETNDPGHWAIIFHDYDHLALVNTAAYMAIGGWDTQIPYYMTDCDMHARIRMAGYKTADRKLGHMWDVAATFDDLSVLYRKKSLPAASFVDPETGDRFPPEGKPIRSLSESPDLIQRGGDFKKDNTKWAEEDTLNSPDFQRLRDVAQAIQNNKMENPRGRNTWQGRQSGGQGEPFYRNPSGFEHAIAMAIQHGREVFAEKWGHRDCDIEQIGMKISDAWMVKHDWEE